MPLTRYLIRNEYGLADPQVYREVEKDDPEALLEGIAMAGLIGILRQLGDLAEFASDLFHNLHEEIMSTSARGHGLVIRVQQVEVDLPSVERALLTRANHLNFAYTAGIDWHCNLRDEHNLVARGDLPRFVMDSYEECRAPPRLFLLDKYDVAGAGACLKRFSDPSIFRMDLSTSGSLGSNTVYSDKRARRVKKGLKQKNGETLQALLDSQTNYTTLCVDATNAKAGKLPRHVAKLKIRQMNGYGSSKKKLDRTYMEQILDTDIDEDKNNLSLRPLSTENPLNDANSISKFHDQGEQHFADNLHTEGTPSTKKLKNGLALPSTEPGSAIAVTISRKSAEVAINGVDKDQMFIDDVNNVEMDAKGDFVSELETYMDALATIESELEADSPSRTNNEVELFAMDLQDIDSESNGDHPQQPSVSYDSHVDSSPASYGSTDSFVKDNPNHLSTNATIGLMDVKSSCVAKILPIDDGLEKTYSVLDSKNMIELKVVSPVPCDSPHLENIEGTCSSSVDDTLVSSFTCGPSSNVEEMSSIISIMLSESNEQNCVESLFPNIIGDVLQESIQESCTASTLDANELPCQQEGFRVDKVQSPLPFMLEENTGDNKSPVEETIHVACIEDISSTSTSEISSDSLLQKSSTFACPHEESCIAEVQPAYRSFLENNAEHISVSPEISVDTHIVPSLCSRMSGEASCAPLAPSVAPNVPCPNDKSSMDEGKIAAPIFLPDGSGQDKSVGSAVFYVTNDIYCDGSSSDGASGVLCTSSVVDTASVTPCSLEESTEGEVLTLVSVMSPGQNRVCKSLECDNSDKAGQDLLGCANLLPESQESSSTASSFEAMSAYHCTREGTGTDFHHLAYPADTGDKISNQFHDNLISGKAATSGLSKPSLLMKGEEIEQCEADISVSKDIISSSPLIDLCTPCDFGTEAQNSALYNQNFKILPEAVIVEGETVPMDSESVETITDDILPFPSHRNTVDPTPVVPQEDCDIKESAETDLLCPTVHYTLTENHKLMLNRSSNESDEGTTEGDQLYSARSESGSGDFPTKIAVNEIESVSEAYREAESLELLPVSNGNLGHFKSKPIFASIEGFPDYVDIEPVSVVTKTVEPECEIEDKHISDEILSPKIAAIKSLHPVGTASESMLLNMVLEATPQSDISDLCSSDCCRLEERDSAREILCDNARFHLEGDRDPCQEVVDQKPAALPEVEPDSGHEYGPLNCSISHESLPSVIHEKMHMDIGSGSHDSGPGEKVLDSEEISSSCATIQDIPSGISPSRQHLDTFRSIVSSHKKSDPETDLGPVTIFHSSQVIGHDKIVTDLPSFHEFVQHPNTCVSVREYNSVLDEPVNNDYTESVLESVSAASNEEKNSDQHEFHAEQVSMVPVVAVTDRHELQGSITPMRHGTQLQDQCDIVEECANCMQSNNLNYVEFKNNKLMGFGHHHRLPEHDSIPVPVSQVDLYLKQNSSINSADVVPSLYIDNHASIFELPVMENLREQVRTNCHNTYEDNDVLSCSPSAADIASLAAPTREFVETPVSSQIKQYASSISMLESCLSDVSPMTSSAFYSSCAPIQPETANSETHELGHTRTSSNSSEAPVLPHLGHVPEWMPPLPLPPMEWILGKPRRSFFLLSAETYHQPSIVPDTTMTEASHSNGALPWKRCSLYKRSKDPLIQAVASHDKSRLKKVAERGPIVRKPKPDEAVALHDKSRLRKVTAQNGVEIKPKPDEAVLSHDKSRLKKVAERDLVDSKPKPDEAVSSQDKFRLRKITGRESIETKTKFDEAVVSHGKSRLRKVTERDEIEIKSKPDERDVLLEQIRAKSFNLKPTTAPRRAVHVPTTNIKVAAILEKAKAIRQAHAGTGSDDEDDDADKWSDA